MKSIALLLVLASAAAAITKEQVERIVLPAVEVAHLDSVAVGVIDAGGRRVWGFGKNPPTARTVFEIGSISKVFTATLLAEMVQRGEVSLDMPVRDLLPAEVKVPSKDDVQITLLHLATHMSGLQRMPENLDVAAELVDPYANYTPAMLYEALSAMGLSRKPGVQYEYSNLGMGLLGHALSRKAGKSYEELIVERICTPLGMDDTKMTLDDDLRGRLAAGHDLAGVPMPNWHFDALAGAGAIRSTPHDMLKFLAANLAPDDSPLGRALKLTHERRGSADESDIALGWHIGTRTGTRWHNGATAGYNSFAAFVPGKGIGVVVLSNTGTPWVDKIGVQLIQRMLDEQVEPAQR